MSRSSKTYRITIDFCSIPVESEVSSHLIPINMKSVTSLLISCRMLWEYACRLWYYILSDRKLSRRLRHWLTSVLHSTASVLRDIRSFLFHVHAFSKLGFCLPQNLTALKIILNGYQATSCYWISYLLRVTDMPVFDQKCNCIYMVIRMSMGSVFLYNVIPVSYTSVVILLCQTSSA